MEFLNKNKEREDVATLRSGLQFTVLEEDQGIDVSPNKDDVATFHYQGWTMDGELFESTLESGKPATIALSHTIDGFSEALTRKSIGDKSRIFISPELAYGEEGVTGIGPNEVLIFEIELIDVEEG